MKRRNAIVLAGVFAVFIALTLCGVTSAEASATSIIITSSEDAYVYLNSPDSNYGTGDVFVDGKDTKRGLYTFDLSSIPSGATIQSATLSLYATTVIRSYAVEAHGATSTWSESSVTWNTQPSFDSTATSSVVTVASQFNNWTVTSDVQYFVDNLAQNHGWALKYANEGRYAPRSTVLKDKGAAPSQQPKLYVTYTSTSSGMDFAVFSPGIAFDMSVEEQNEVADYLMANVNAKSKNKYSYSEQSSLAAWMNSNKNDGEVDVLVILDMCPYDIYHGEDDGSLAEDWMDSGDMIIWSGSQPFYMYVGASGGTSSTGAGDAGANDIFDVSGSSLCTGDCWQLKTLIADTYLPSFVEYRSTKALKYDDLITESTTNTWDNVPDWMPETIFAEDSEGEEYSSDSIVLKHKNGGGYYAQFYCGAELAAPPIKEVLAEFLNNWVSIPFKTIYADVNNQNDPLEDGTIDHPFDKIQEGINAASTRDTVLVRDGLYNEQIVMKEGIKLVSDSSNGGNDLIPGPGYAEIYGEVSKKVLRRANRTIIDGTGFPNGTEAKSMIEFPEGATIATQIDGFSIQNMPDAPPADAHVAEFRGASGTAINCIAHDNGATGFGSLASFPDQDKPWGERDLRYQNIRNESHPIIVNNVAYRQIGKCFGNNWYGYAIIFKNEAFESITPDGIYPHGPAITNCHGSHGLVVDNLVYKADWVGVGGKMGGTKGSTNPVNRPTHPIIRGNRVYDSGDNDATGIHGAGIGADNTGGYDPKLGRIVYQVIEDNYVNGASNAGIGCRRLTGLYHQGGYVIIRNNTVSNGGRCGEGAGIGLNSTAHVVEISGNVVHHNHDAGIGLKNGAHADLIANNTAYSNGMAGIGVKGSAHADLITGNTVYSNSMAGIGIKEGASAGIIENNNAYDNTMAGIGNDGTSGAVTVDAIRNNVVTSNGEVGIGMHYASIGEISGNTIENNQNPGIGVRDGSVVNLIADNILSGNGVSGTVGFAVREGSIVHIENTTVTHSGKPNLCVLEGSSATIANSTLEYSGQYDGSGPNLRVSSSNVTVTGCFIYESAVPGVVADNSELDFRDNIVARSLHWAMMLTSCSGTLDGNEFYENAYGGGGCLYISGGGDWDITRNILHHPAWYNNQIYLDATTSSVYSNTICGRADGGGGPLNFGPGDGVNVVGGTADIKDNIFYRLPRAITGNGSKTVDYNCYWMMRDSSYNLGDHKVEQDPLFVDPDGYDHTLQSTSPCIDAGIDVGLPYCGSAPDLGAEEYCM